MKKIVLLATFLILSGFLFFFWNSNPKNPLANLESISRPPNERSPGEWKEAKPANIEDKVGTKSKSPDTSYLERLIADTLKSLPNIRDVEARGEVQHGVAPPSLVALSPLFTEIFEMTEQSNFHKQLAKDFFDECARKNGTLLSARAVCLKNLIGLEPSTLLSPYPSAIVAITRDLPEL